MMIFLGPTKGWPYASVSLERRSDSEECGEGKKASVDVVYMFMLFTSQWVFALLNCKCELEHYCVH